MKVEKRTRAPRRPAGFWQTFNDWWRGILNETGKRPTTAQVRRWYEHEAQTVWPDAVDRPDWRDTRIHAKCLRSTEEVRLYFKSYRDRKRTEGQGPGASVHKRRISSAECEDDENMDNEDQEEACEQDAAEGDDGPMPDAAGAGASLAAGSQPHNAFIAQGSSPPSEEAASSSHQAAIQADTPPVVSVARTQPPTSGAGADAVAVTATVTTVAPALPTNTPRMRWNSMGMGTPNAPAPTNLNLPFPCGASHPCTPASAPASAPPSASMPPPPMRAPFTPGPTPMHARAAGARARAHVARDLAAQVDEVAASVPGLLSNPRHTTATFPSTPMWAAVGSGAEGAPAALAARQRLPHLMGEASQHGPEAMRVRMAGQQVQGDAGGMEDGDGGDVFGNSVPNFADDLGATRGGPAPMDVMFGEVPVHRSQSMFPYTHLPSHRRAHTSDPYVGQHPGAAMGWGVVGQNGPGSPLNSGASPHPSNPHIHPSLHPPPHLHPHLTGFPVPPIPTESRQPLFSAMPSIPLMSRRSSDPGPDLAFLLPLQHTLAPWYVREPSWRDRGGPSSGGGAPPAVQLALQQGAWQGPHLLSQDPGLTQDPRYGEAHHLAWQLPSSRPIVWPHPTRGLGPGMQLARPSSRLDQPHPSLSTVFDLDADSRGAEAPDMSAFLGQGGHMPPQQYHQQGSGLGPWSTGDLAAGRLPGLVYGVSQPMDCDVSTPPGHNPTSEGREGTRGEAAMAAQPVQFGHAHPSLRTPFLPLPMYLMSGQQLPPQQHQQPLQQQQQQQQQQSYPHAPAKQEHPPSSAQQPRSSPAAVPVRAASHPLPTPRPPLMPIRTPTTSIAMPGFPDHHVQSVAQLENATPFGSLAAAAAAVAAAGEPQTSSPDENSTATRQGMEVMGCIPPGRIAMGGRSMSVPEEALLGAAHGTRPARMSDTQLPTTLDRPHEPTQALGDTGNDARNKKPAADDGGEKADVGMPHASLHAGFSDLLEPMRSLASISVPGSVGGSGGSRGSTDAGRPAAERNSRWGSYGEVGDGAPQKEPRVAGDPVWGAGAVRIKDEHGGPGLCVPSSQPEPRNADGRGQETCVVAASANDPATAQCFASNQARDVQIGSGSRMPPGHMPTHPPPQQATAQQPQPLSPGNELTPKYMRAMGQAGDISRGGSYPNVEMSCDSPGPNNWPSGQSDPSGHDLWDSPWIPRHIGYRDISDGAHPGTPTVPSSAPHLPRPLFATPYQHGPTPHSASPVGYGGHGRYLQPTNFPRGQGHQYDHVYDGHPHAQHVSQPPPQQQRLETPHELMAAMRGQGLPSAMMEEMAAACGLLSQLQDNQPQQVMGPSGHQAHHVHGYEEGLEHGGQRGRGRPSADAAGGAAPGTYEAVGTGQGLGADASAKQVHTQLHQQQPQQQAHHDNTWALPSWGGDGWRAAAAAAAASTAAGANAGEGPGGDKEKEEVMDEDILWG